VGRDEGVEVLRGTTFKELAKRGCGRLRIEIACQEVLFGYVDRVPQQLLFEEALAFTAVELVGATTDVDEVTTPGSHQMLDQLAHALTVVVHHRGDVETGRAVTNERERMARADKRFQRSVAEHV